MGEEKLEDEAHRDAADEAGKVQCTPEELAALALEAQDGGKQQRQRHLHHRTYHVVKAQAQSVEAVFAGKDRNVVLQTHKGTSADVLHFEEAELHHLKEGQIGEHEQQHQRNEQEHQRDDELLAAHTVKVFAEALALFRRGYGCGRCHVKDLLSPKAGRTWARPADL